MTTSPPSFAQRHAHPDFMMLRGGLWQVSQTNTTSGTFQVAHISSAEAEASIGLLGLPLQTGPYHCHIADLFDLLRERSIAPFDCHRSNQFFELISV
jgi:hypothetical protein